MPELPEVETVARQLNHAVSGRKITRLEIYDKKRIKLKTEPLCGAKINSVSRVGKQVLIECQIRSEPVFVSVHLRMTGRLIWTDSGSHKTADSKIFLHSQTTDDQKHCRARFVLNQGNLDFFDTRRFGTISIGHSRNDFLPKGLDPTSSAFTVAALERLLDGSKQALKIWLLRQDRLVGIGNIYASEILFSAKIHPNRLANSLSAGEISALHRSTIKILNRAIECCGTTFSDFQDSSGEIGSFQRYLKVYERDSLPCKRCKSPISKARQAQRSTYFCPSCQPARKQRQPRTLAS